MIYCKKSFLFFFLEKKWNKNEVDFCVDKSNDNFLAYILVVNI